MNSDDPILCGLCTNVIKETIDVITCSLCHAVFHFGCCFQSTFLHCDSVNWICIHCNREVFPFVEDDEEFKLNDTIKTDDTIAVELNGLNLELTAVELNGLNLELDVFPDESGNRILLNNADTDPDLNYFTNVAWSSPYSTFPPLGG
jgi:hypothetical protein